MDDAIEESLASVVGQILKNSGDFGDFALKKDDGSKTGLNFMGTIEELAVFVDGRRVAGVVAKRGFSSAALCESFGGTISYETERRVYADVIPALHRLQRSTNSDEYPHVARCYGSNLERLREVFVLENLKAEGFAVRPSRTEFDGAHASLVLEELAGYHAACFALREQQPNEWKRLVGGDSPIGGINYFYRNDVVRKLSRSRLGKLKAALITGGKPDLANRLGDFMANTDAYVDKILAIDEYSIIYHGDMWCSNIMFRQDGEGRPTDVRLLDWQASRVGHQCFDLTYFVYMSCSREVTDDVGRYMRIYHERFSSQLRKLGGDPDALFPYGAFEEQWKTCSTHALLLSACVLCGLYIEADEFPDLGAVAESGGDVYASVDFGFRRTREYNDRLEQVLVLCLNQISRL